MLYALGLDAGRLPTPRADGAREALRILLGARRDITLAATAQTNRLRALLRDGTDQDKSLARAALTDRVLAGLIRRRLPRDSSRQQSVRHAELRRLAVALRQADRELKNNRTELKTIVDELVPGLTERPGVGLAM